jgi:hypothetical protein
MKVAVLEVIKIYISTASTVSNRIYLLQGTRDKLRGTRDKLRGTRDEEQETSSEE